MYSLFENSFKKLYLISRIRYELKKKTKESTREIICELKNEIRGLSIYDMKNNYITTYVIKENTFKVFNPLWIKINNFSKIRNSIIHNDCNITKSVDKHTRKKNLLF